MNARTVDLIVRWASLLLGIAVVLAAMSVPIRVVRHAQQTPTQIAAWPPPQPAASPIPPLEPPAAMNFTESDWYLSHSEPVCIALVVWAEARGEPIEGKLAVADLVLNRAGDHALPCDVIRKLDQFAIAGHNGVPQPHGDDPVWLDCLFAAVSASRDRADPVKLGAHVDQTRGARCMLSPANMPDDRALWPRWSRTKPVAVIGGHSFFDCVRPATRSMAKE